MGGVVFFLLIGVGSLALGLGLWRQHLGAASLTAAVFLAVVWVLAFYAYSTDWHDAGGAFDCWPQCTALENTVAVVYFLAPLTASILVLVALIAAILLPARSKGENRVILSVSLFILLTVATIVAL